MIGQQMSIPQLKAHMAQTRIALGTAGEILIAKALEAAGYRVDVSHKHLAGDLCVVLDNGSLIQIEVKTARRNSSGNYAFTLYKHWQGRLCTDSRQADIVIFLCVLKTGDAIPFVVPAAVVGNRRSAAVASFPTTYRGWLAPYRQDIHKLRIEL